MTDAKRLQEIKKYGVNQAEVTWLIQRVEQLEKEVQNLRDALASG
jgi:polyhydroxyalkanoate synthesis regulator phasin